jgi:hypothetical protein
MASKSFTAQVDDIVRECEKRQIALVRESNKRLAERVQTPVAKGGKMRVDTGFLRSTGQMSLNGLPQGPIRPPESGNAGSGVRFRYTSTSVTTALAGFRMGQPIFFGWSAEYAAAREVFDAFLESGLMDWQKIVDEVTNEIRQRAG